MKRIDIEVKDSGVKDIPVKRSYQDQEDGLVKTLCEYGFSEFHNGKGIAIPYYGL